MSEYLSVLHRSWAQINTQAYYDVYWIIKNSLNIDWKDLPDKRLQDFSEEQVRLLEKNIALYKEGKPLAYILKEVSFYGLSLYIDERALIPREDTEPMVAAIIKRLKKGDSILELGTGSGAIACAIASKIPEVKITAIEASTKACEVAKYNIQRLGLSNIKLIEKSWYDKIEGQFDWVIANPPYIDVEDPYLDPSTQYEPKEALFSDHAGYKDLFYLIKASKQWLSPFGCIALEHGFKQQEGVVEALKSFNYKHIYVGTDHTHPRFIIASLDDTALS